MGFCLWVLFITWELPQAVLAGIITLFSYKRVSGIEIYKNSKILYVKDFPGGISLGRLIFLNDRYQGDDMSRKHEYGHSLQSLFLGWAYLPIVGLPSILRVLVWRKKKLDKKKYYQGYPEDWANRLGFNRNEYIEVKRKLK